MHYGNLIASGDQPVFVDLETLFHPLLNNRSSKTADEPSDYCLPYTASFTGLLPATVWASKDHTGVDISGLNARGGQLLPFDNLSLSDEGTDQIRLTKKPIYTDEGNHRAIRDGEAVSPNDYFPDIADGFECGYRVLLQQRSVLTGNEGPLTAFSSCLVRRVLRDTRAYDALLMDSFHPDYLRDKTTRRPLFQKLRASESLMPWQSRMYNQEVRDIENGDIPCFQCDFDSRNIIDAHNQVTENYFAQSGSNLIDTQIASLSENDLQNQLWIIKSTLGLASHKSPSMGRSHSTQTDGPKNPFVEEACAIGDRLAELAMVRNGCAYWASSGIGSSAHASAIQPGYFDIYQGQMGVAIFMAALAHESKNSRYAFLARAALEPIVRRHQEDILPFNGIGPSFGLCAYVYGLYLIGRFLSDDTLIREAMSELANLAEQAENDSAPGLLEGSAGTILCLSNFPSSPEINSYIKQTIARCVDHIVSLSEPQNEGIAWPQLDGGRPLTGFAHGAAGYAAALGVAGHYLQRPDLTDLARRGCEFERANFLPNEQNWADLRNAENDDSAGSKPIMTAWCHGAAGIALSRLILHRHSHDTTERQRLEVEIHQAVATILRRGFGNNHSLCHGDLGNADILLSVARHFNDGELITQAETEAKKILHSIQSNGRRCGLGPVSIATPFQELPGLMTGLSGIGYGLLRIENPAEIPSVLDFSVP